MRIGSGLDGRRLRHTRESLTRAVGKGLPDVTTFAGVSLEELTVSIGGTETVNSVPATFAFTDTGSTVCAFSIPVPRDEYSSGYWRAAGSVVDGATFPNPGESITVNGVTVNLDTHSNGVFDLTKNLSAGQLSYVNAQAGNSVNVTYDCQITYNPGGSESVTAFQMVLTQADVTYPVFILGVDDPDGSTLRWVP